MTGKVAAGLVFIAQVCTGIGALILTADEVPFGLDAHDVGLSLVWASNIATVIVVAIRRNLVPGVETGIGDEGTNV